MHLLYTGERFLKWGNFHSEVKWIRLGPPRCFEDEHATRGELEKRSRSIDFPLKFHQGDRLSGYEIELLAEWLGSLWQIIFSPLSIHRISKS
jgi:hypothetical protein